MSSFFAWRLRGLVALLCRLTDALPFWHCKKTGKALCIISGGLGDKLMALPAARFLATRFPSNRLTVVFVGGAPPFMLGEPFTALSIKSNRVQPLLRIAMHGYDEVFVSSIGAFNVWNEAAAWLSRASVRRGPLLGNQNPRKSAYSYPYAFGDRHETIVNLSGAGAPCGAGVTPCSYQLCCTSRQSLVKGRSVQIGVHATASAGGETKRWPSQHFARLFEMGKSSGWLFVLFGTADESAYLQGIAAKATNARVSVCSTLDEAAIRMSEMDAFIGNDSGLCHLAASLRIPVVTMFGPTDPSKCSPVGEQVTTLVAKCSKAYCYWSGCPCDGCIRQISPEDAFTALQEALLAGAVLGSRNKS